MPEMRSLGVADDIRAAWRSLRRRTAVTATAVLLLAVGIAVAATTFAVVHAIALRPLAQAGADRLVTPVTTDPSRNVTAGLVSYPQFLEWSATPGLFERLSLPAPGPRPAQLLFEIRPADPVTFVAVPIVFALVAFAASAIPARHAARFDPATTLRGE
jgi:ABC-type lipoprotein release transport system permease subunit